MYADIGLRIDVEHTVAHDVGLILADGPPRGDDLAVDVRQADLVVVNEVKGADAAADKRLAGIAADAANAEDRHARVLQGLHGRVAEQQFGSGERIEHGEMFLRTVDSRRRAVQIMIQRIAYRVNRLLRHFRRIPAAG